MAKDFGISLKNCRFYGYHGVLDAEKEQGQPFVVDAELTVAGTTGIETDKVEDTLDYSKVFERIEAIVTGQRYDLIEHLAYQIAKYLCEAFPSLVRAEITVKKPQAPIDGSFDHVAVTVVHEQ